jgi:hypothetical protein
VNLFVSIRPLLKELNRNIVFILIFISAALVAYGAQNPVLNPKESLQELSWILFLVFLLSVIYFFGYRHWTRWIAVGVTAIAAGSFSAAALEIWG